MWQNLNITHKNLQVFHVCTSSRHDMMITMLAPDCASLSPGLCKIVSRRDTTSYSADTLARPHITLMSNQAVVPRRGTLTSKAQSKRSADCGMWNIPTSCLGEVHAPQDMTISRFHISPFKFRLSSADERATQTSCYIQPRGTPPARCCRLAPPSSALTATARCRCRRSSS